MRQINILHLRDSYEIGGPGKTIIETQRSINPERFRLHLAAFLTRHESGETPFLAAANACGIPVHVVRGFNQFDPRLASRLGSLVKTLGIDVVHAHEAKSDAIAWLSSRLQPVPIVTTLHGWIGNSLRQRSLIALDKRVVRHFDRVIAVSAQIAGELAAAGVLSGQGAHPAQRNRYRTLSADREAGFL